MDKNEILEKSRAENKNGDERVQDINLKAANIGNLVSLILALIYAIVGMFVLENRLLLFACLSIVHIGAAVRNWISFAKLKRKNDLIYAIIQTALSGLTIAIVIIDIVKVF